MQHQVKLSEQDEYLGVYSVTSRLREAALINAPYCC